MTHASPAVENVEADDAPIVDVRDLHKRFDALEVIRGVSFSLERGRCLSLLGASGSGKSTLLRCLNHLEVPSSGEVWIDGRPMGFRVEPDGSHVPAALPAVNRLRQDIGMVFQQFNLWPHMTVLQNVIEAPVRVRGLARDEAIAVAESLLGKVDLLDKRDVYPARLSGGQQQRVAIARALAMSPKVMLFDEPTSSLDPELTGEVLDVMRALAAEGMTMIVVTHEIGFARSATDRTIFLHEGRVEEDGPPERVLNDPCSERCRAFLSRVAG